MIAFRRVIKLTKKATKRIHLSGNDTYRQLRRTRISLLRSVSYSLSIQNQSCCAKRRKSLKMLSTLRHGLRKLSGVRQFSGKYQKTLEKHPVLMQALQAGALMGAGDFLAQTVLEKTEVSQLDYVRTAKFFSIGFFIAGPGLRKWYGVLDKRVTAKTPMGRTVQKVCVDQFVFAPFFLAALLSVIGYSQHQDVEKVKDKIQNDYVDILTSNYAVWPWVQLINFRFVPLNYQVLLTQSVAVLWNIYFSWRTNLSERATPAVPSPAAIPISMTTSTASGALQLQTEEQVN